MGYFGFDPTIRIADVILDESARRSIELGIAVAESHRWGIGIFATEEEARRWLLKS